MDLTSVKQRIEHLHKNGKHEYEFQALGEEMESWFGKDRLLYQIFYFKGCTEERVRDAFAWCKRKDIKNPRAMIGFIKKKYERN